MDYTDEEELALAHYLRPYCDDPYGLLLEWANGFVSHGGDAQQRL